jgi:type III secretion protein L
MGGYYRLKELGYRLPAGAQILSKEEFAPIEATTTLLTDAEARAKAIVAEAETAYQRECVRGYEDGLAKAKLDAAERLLQESGMLDAKLREVERDLVHVVSASVRKLVDTFDDTTRAEAVVRGALRQMRREKKAELRVSPEQVGHFKLSIASIIKEFPEVEMVDVIEDTTLTAPQVVLETSIGRVEGDFGQRLIELEEILRTTASQRSEDLIEPAVEAKVVEAKVVEAKPE